MILLDTHAWIWYVDDPSRLGASALAGIQRAREAEESLFISCISTWELHMLVAKQRLDFSVPPEVWVSRCESIGCFRFQAINNTIATLSVQACADLHADPADRIIVATALYLGANLISADRKLRESGLVPCIW